MSQRDIGLGVLNAQETITYANDAAPRMIAGLTVGEVIGRPLSEFLPAEVLSEVRALFDRLRKGEGAVVRRAIRNGREIYATIRRIVEPGGGEEFLCLIRYGSMADPGEEGAAQSDSAYVDLGALDVLTPRELQVLALLGSGMRIRDIAATLHRSENTIERHRESIGRKLQETDRIRLAKIAIEAGLRVTDAELPRVSLRRRHRETDGR